MPETLAVTLDVAVDDSEIEPVGDTDLVGVPVGDEDLVDVGVTLLVREGVGDMVCDGHDGLSWIASAMTNFPVPDPMFEIVTFPVWLKNTAPITTHS